jgi:hypothetical protein
MPLKEGIMVDRGQLPFLPGRLKDLSGQFRAPGNASSLAVGELILCCYKLSEAVVAMGNELDELHAEVDALKAGA